ncbi:hypothetical protein [Natronorubrum texcoconense]|uniref:Uncharacterized protein n=1 Tax=Natronorubrum texcoconense TaxID=1095776 RepID=A0A1G8TDU6_9EURY|nr:hypothetical protein [Natronorubrum texcoconense]SDJ39564.1 hypothetical protein SAMN04515672_0425 [Natronorubrum texcoconense]
MPGSLVAVLGVVAAFLSGLSIAMVVRHRRRRHARSELADALDDRLAEALGPGTGSHLERSPAVRRIAVVDADAESRSGPAGEGDGSAGEGGGSTDEDDRAMLVPIVRVDLETTDAPGMKIILEYVADVLEAIHPELEARDERVHRYDVEFTFGPGGLIVAGECRRVSVAPELAARLLEDERYGAFELRRDVERADRDDDSPTALWDDCRSSADRH